ncbi:hypothetical protein [Spongiactinospora sp. TRM90649]|uniref:hypothetical protein n=1 Tax=Spongiactinospora sp. TRM90649 TaxID=3031114 RepID=UPI0023F673E5|nr:hypothetical protein [Spongiactinospora sp. TRM90649]MDF5752190.1 hypothetical protein [Spongiactinospora sp. TRM90649]
MSSIAARDREVGVDLVGEVPQRRLPQLLKGGEVLRGGSERHVGPPGDQPMRQALRAHLDDQLGRGLHDHPAACRKRRAAGRCREPARRWW